MELILRGRDPRDAWLFAERICGASTTVHALASVRAVENALGVTIPRNARLLRNLVAGAQYLTDHVVHFYHLHALDWVDVVAALRADPAATSKLARSMSDWPLSSPTYFREVRDRIARSVETGRGGPFANGYWGHPAYRLPPELNLVIVAHYLEALAWQRSFSRFHVLVGGKNPHAQAFVVGGMAAAPPWGGPAQSRPGEHPPVDQKAPVALSETGLADMAGLIAEARTFVEDVYVRDTLAIAREYRDWAALGGGIGNYLSYGEFPEDDAAGSALLLPRGRVMSRKLGSVEPVDQSGVAETVAHAHYDDEGDDGVPRNPFDGRTEPAYGGPPLPFTTLEGFDRYSWIKAPRYDDEPMEVGALARMLVAFVEGRREVRAALQRAMDALDLGPEGLFGTLGRVVARALEAEVVAGQLERWLSDLRGTMAGGDLALVDLSKSDPAGWPGEATGWSLGEAPGGALGHWVRVRDQVVEAYQVVDPNTWNGSPRDAGGRRGAWEEALVGTPLADAARPLEILRTVHSFDPCTACAAHALGPGAGGTVGIRVV
jgi:Ni,Fe-hydrogenase I large subunit